MSINLLTEVQKNLGYPALKKIDPNTQEVKQDPAKPNKDRMAQAVVPAVLAGIYKLAKNEKGIEQIADETGISNWVEIIFGDNKEEVLRNVSAYTYYDRQAVRLTMNEAAAETVKMIRKYAKAGKNFTEMKSFIAGQRDHILPFLPAALHIGNLLDDTTMDDRTNKMAGPISSLMHKIETSFSAAETKEDADRKANTF